MARPQAWTVALVLGVGILAVALFLVSRPRSSLGTAVDTLREDALFSTSREAAESFVAVGEQLRVAGRRCAEAESRTSPRCSALLAGAAYMEVAALRVVDCTRPGVFDARRAAVAYLDDLGASVEADPPTDAPGPPQLPRC